MKTLLLSEVFPPQTGGSGRWLWEVYRRLPRESMAVVAGEHPQAAEFDRTHNVCIDRVPLAMRSWGLASRVGIADYWNAARRISKIVQSDGVSQIHCGKCLPEGMLAWLLRRRFSLPYVCYVHGEELNIAAGSRELAWLTRRVFRDANIVVANSHNTLKLLRDDWGVTVQQGKVLHPGVDAQRFRPAATNQSDRRALGWEGRWVVLTVGRLQRRKGHDMLIRALRLVRDHCPEVLYAIVGGGEERERLMALVENEGVSAHVQFCGEVDDEQLIRCYQQCDLFALPNREVEGDFEGFGMVLVEAQACGKPVLAGASGGTAETLRVGVTGELVDCRNPERIAETIVELANNPQRRAAMGDAARQWVVESFDWQSLVKQAETMLFR